MGNRWDISRRQLLKTGGAIVGGAMLLPLLQACGTSAPTSAPQDPQAGSTKGFDWKRFKGKEINVFLSLSPATQYMQGAKKEFEDLTGIKANVDVLPEQQQRKKLAIDMAAGGGDIDVFTASYHVEKKRFLKNGWFQDVGPYLKNPGLTSPDFDWEGDFTQAGKDIVLSPDGKITGIPDYPDVFVLFYRKDLFEQKGLKPPTKFEDLEPLIKQFHNPPNMYGWLSRGLKNANIVSWGWFYMIMGGQWVKDGKSLMDQPEAINSVKEYARLLHDYGPPGSVNFNWNECSSAFMQGQAPLYFDGINFAAQFEDKDKSKIAGKVGYTVLPPGPKGQYTPLFGVGTALSPFSKNKEAAWYWLQWAHSKEMAKRLLKEAGVGSTRNSAWADLSLRQGARMPADWFDAYEKSLPVARLGLPYIVGVTEFRDIVGVAIQKAIQGDDVTQAMQAAHQEVQKMLDSTEK